MANAYKLVQTPTDAPAFSATLAPTATQSSTYAHQIHAPTALVPLINQALTNANATAALLGPTVTQSLTNVANHHARTVVFATQTAVDTIARVYHYLLAVDVTLK